MLKRIIEVPQLMSDYPSTNVLNWTVDPNCFNRVIIAVGSVADRILPIVKAYFHDRS